ncbi:MAG: enoyl-CoA hydratase/isomerase family protein, partial [Candidatus Zixiibacteriota bacterium]
MTTQVSEPETATRMDYKLIKVEHDGPVATLAINRPDALNALNDQMVAEMRHYLRSIWYDDELRVIIVTGEGKAFISGADIAELATMDVQQGIKKSAAGQHLMKSFENIPKVTIAAVNGF